MKVLQNSSSNILQINVGRAPCHVTAIKSQAVVCELRNVAHWSGVRSITMRVNGISVPCTDCWFDLLSTETQHQLSSNAFDSGNLRNILIVTLALMAAAMLILVLVCSVNLTRTLRSDQNYAAGRQFKRRGEFFLRFIERFYGTTSAPPERIQLSQPLQIYDNGSFVGCDDHYYSEILERPGLESAYERPISANSARLLPSPPSIEIAE